MKAPAGSWVRREAILLMVRAHMIVNEEDAARKLLADTAAEFKGTPHAALHEAMQKEVG